MEKLVKHTNGQWEILEKDANAPKLDSDKQTKFHTAMADHYLKASGEYLKNNRPEEAKYLLDRHLEHTNALSGLKKVDPEKEVLKGKGKE